MGRAEDFAHRWRAGETMNQIGRSAGLSRERVRQLIRLVDHTPGVDMIHERVTTIRERIGALRLRGLTYRQIARCVGRSKECVAGHCRAIGIRLPKPPLRPHGTRARYNRGCRCDPCRQASTRYCYEWKQAAREDVRGGKRTIAHGTENAYSNYACRCDPCRRAGSRRNKASRQARMSR